MNKPQILVVEDDTAVGNLITTTLETQNYLFHFPWRFSASSRRHLSPVLPPENNFCHDNHQQDNSNNDPQRDQKPFHANPSLNLLITIPSVSWICQEPSFSRPSFKSPVEIPGSP